MAANRSAPASSSPSKFRMESVVLPPEAATSDLSTITDQQLGHIWQRMGLDPAALAERKRTACKVLLKSLSETLGAMVAEEEATLAQLVDRVEAHAKERIKLGKELGITLSDPDLDLGLVQMEKLLRDDLNKLRAEKDERMKVVLELKREDKAICKMMEVEPFSISSYVIPSEDQLERLRGHIKEMQSLKTQREAKFAEIKLTILSFLEVLESEPENSFERQVVCEPEDMFILSADNMDAVEKYLEKLEKNVEANKEHATEMRERIFSLIRRLELGGEERQIIEQELSGHRPSVLKQLKQKLDELEVLKMEKLGQFVDATKQELVSFWDLCCYSQEQRDKFAAFYDEDVSESLLDTLEQEVKRLRQYFEANEGLFHKVIQRQELWNKMLEMEEMQKDPNHVLKAKPGQLLREEKERKRVNKMLPKLDNELKGAMTQFYEEHGQHFLVGGVPYEDFIVQQEENHLENQKSEREWKQRERKEQAVLENIYGSKPVTPAKRAANNTLKRKALGPMTPGQVGQNVTKRMRPELTLATMMQNRSTVHRAGAKSAGTSNKSRYGLRPGAGPGARRRVLGDNNGSSICGGASNTLKHDLDSITSDHFAKGAPYLSSTFKAETPEPTLTQRRRSKRLLKAPVESPIKNPTFKTPKNRVLTPANKSSARGALTHVKSGRKVPFLL